MGRIFALQQIFEKSWECAKEDDALFVDLEKAYDRISRETSFGRYSYSIALMARYKLILSRCTNIHASLDLCSCQ